MYQVAWAGLRICMSRAHKRRRRLNGNGYRLLEPAPRLPRATRLPSASPPTTRLGMDLPMSKIGSPKRIIEIEPIEEPAAEPVKVPEPAKVPERV